MKQQNGRSRVSRENIVPARAESSLLELCRAQPIFKVFKYLASESRAKFT
jgi:hypothetical protein